MTCLPSHSKRNFTSSFTEDAPMIISKKNYTRISFSIYYFSYTTKLTYENMGTVHCTHQQCTDFLASCSQPKRTSPKRTPVRQRQVSGAGEKAQAHSQELLVYSRPIFVAHSTAPHILYQYYINQE